MKKIMSLSLVLILILGTLSFSLQSYAVNYQYSRHNLTVNWNADGTNVGVVRGSNSPSSYAIFGANTPITLGNQTFRYTYVKGLRYTYGGIVYYVTLRSNGKAFLSYRSGTTNYGEWLN